MSAIDNQRLSNQFLPFKRTLRSNSSPDELFTPPTEAPVEKKQSKAQVRKEKIETVFWRVVCTVKREKVAGSLGKKWHLKVQNAAEELIGNEYLDNIKSINTVSLSALLRQIARGN